MSWTSIWFHFPKQKADLPLVWDIHEKDSNPTTKDWSNYKPQFQIQSLTKYKRIYVCLSRRQQRSSDGFFLFILCWKSLIQISHFVDWILFSLELEYPNIGLENDRLTKQFLTVFRKKYKMILKLFVHELLAF